MAKKVTIKTRNVGESFGTCGVLHDARTKRFLQETDVYPLGFVGPAVRAAEAIAEARGWTVVSENEDDE